MWDGSGRPGSKPAASQTGWAQAARTPRITPGGLRLREPSVFRFEAECILKQSDATAFHLQLSASASGICLTITRPMATSGSLARIQRRLHEDMIRNSCDFLIRRARGLLELGCGAGDCLPAEALRVGIDLAPRPSPRQRPSPEL